MSNRGGLDRRSFLKSASLTALASATGAAVPAVNVAGSSLVAQPVGPYDFDTIYSRIGTDSSKWDAQIARYGRGSIDVGMGTADQDFRIAPPIIRALRERLGHENYGYYTIPDSYMQSIVNWNKRRHGVDVDPDLILHADGVHPALISTLRAFCPQGSKVLVTAPVYSGFYSDIRIVHCRAEESPLRLVNGQYSIDFDDLERRIDNDTHAMLLCNPQNPTGNVWSRDDLTRLGEICTRRRVVVLSDEIHCDFVTTGHTFTPYATLDGDIVRNSIIYKSVSKSFNLSSMKCAYMFSTNPDYIERISDVGQHRQSMNTLGVIAAHAAQDEAECEDWLSQVVAYIDASQDYVASFVNSNVPHVSYVKPEGTYLAWLDVTELIDAIGAKATAAKETRERGASASPVTPEEVLQRYLVEHAKIHINPGSSYGIGGAGRMRMNIATSRQLVEKALTNLARAAQSV